MYIRVCIYIYNYGCMNYNFTHLKSSWKNGQIPHGLWPCQGHLWAPVLSCLLVPTLDHGELGQLAHWTPLLFENSSDFMFIPKDIWYRWSFPISLQARKCWKFVERPRKLDENGSSLPLMKHLPTAPHSRAHAVFKGSCHEYPEVEGIQEDKATSKSHKWTFGCGLSKIGAYGPETARHLCQSIHFGVMVLWAMAIQTTPTGDRTNKHQNHLIKVWPLGVCLT